MKYSICVLLLITLATLSGFGQKSRPSSNEFKQLGGPAEEIESLRLPVPSETGVTSKAAMIPIREGKQTIEIPIESAAGFRVMLVGRNNGSLEISAKLPGGEVFDPRLRSAFATRTETTYGFGNENYPAEVFAFGKTGAGILTLDVSAPADGLAGDRTLGYLIASSDSPYRLYSFLNTAETVRGRSVGVVARLVDIDNTGSSAGLIFESGIEVRSPSGAADAVKMYDDGAHGDGLAGDGTFGGIFVPTEAGQHVIQVRSSGVTAIGESFLRTGEHVFNVAPAGARFAGTASARQIDDVRFRVELPVGGLPAGQQVVAYAEVWGRDSKSPVAWIGGMTRIERGTESRSLTVPVSIDSRWLLRAPDDAAFELRNVRLQDVDGTVTLGSAERIDLPAISIPKELRTAYFGEITDEMRTGRRPERSVDSAVGGKLMLIHGYCSGGNTFPTSQFSNYIVFNDPNQNRTHDQFANLIKNFGAAYPSFGAVAHSQGGAATLHLYTYYWSGLDNATGPGTRLIQSVGTPYQGTALAGNLALLGQIFGAGCGANSDLSYSGAASWLAGIPTWARAKVYYHTTSFTDVWWRYDYCNLATDPFLSDPEDGVVERAYAQLPGASNLGHKTGWCHTSGMRDPAQTSDSSRNSNMNSNAMR